MTARLSAVFSRHGYLLAIVAIALSTVLFLAGRDWFAKGQWALLYLLVILLVAGAAGTWPAILAAVLAFFSWNFFFLPPYHTLQVHDPQDWLDLGAFLIVGLLVGVQTGRLREREKRAIAREQETAALSRVSAAVASQTSTAQMTETCRSEIVRVLGSGSASVFVLEGDDLRWRGESADLEAPDSAVAERARRVLDDELAGNTAGRVSGAPATVVRADDGALYAAIHSPSGAAGVLAVQARTNGVPYSANAARLVASLANLVGAFLEREQLQAVATKAAAEREGDRLKSSLLSSVSHELKTPLAALTATVSNLLESDVHWDEQGVRDELRAIVGDVARLNNSIGALLDLSRLEAHAWEQRRELYELSDIIAAGIAALPAHLRQRVTVDLPDATPVIEVDFSQWARVLQNLLENAVLYSGENTPVTIGGRAWNEGARIWVEDLGPGIAPEEHDAVFEKFYRGHSTSGHAPSGTGLGLAITREIVRSHGGTIRVEDVAPHGARFVIALPSGPAPAAPATAEESV